MRCCWSCASRATARCDFPVLALVVSGGHTHLFLAEQREGGWHYENVGHTRDDAAGEAFDKTAKLLGLGYPGGPVIDRLAKFGDPAAVKFTFAQLKHEARHEPKRAGRIEEDRKRFDFSYSGIKTAVLRYVETHRMQEAIEAPPQRAAADRRALRGGLPQAVRPADARPGGQLPGSGGERLDPADAGGLREYGVQTLLVTGGVAANSALRASFEQRGQRDSGVQVHFPSRRMSTDNAAMIAAAAHSKWIAGKFAGLELTAEANLPLR